MREVRIWQKLKGPRITPLQGYIPAVTTITGINGPAIISSWRKFGTLSDYLRTSPQADRLNLVAQYWISMSDLYEEIPFQWAGRPDNRLTRSLIQDNLLINGDGEVELYDFGISRVLEDADPESAEESIWPPIAYQPAEFLAENPRSTAADVYAFGGALLEV
ncbi:hypothetical protein FRC00_001945 [Tulasnella sp. 408]|nr:hypothetical protein FRC00_001945 [Tulasnella sp. 408]